MSVDETSKPGAEIESDQEKLLVKEEVVNVETVA